MSKFVNYNKRAVTLPPGRKDLADVLQSKWAAQLKLFGGLKCYGEGNWAGTIDRDAQQFRLRKERFTTGGLAQVERFVSCLTATPRRIEDISIKLPGADGFFTIRPRGDFGLQLNPVFVPDWKRNRAVLEFFIQRKLLPVMGHSSGIGGQGDPDNVRFYPLPTDAKQTSALLVELLRQVYGLTDESGLEFICLEPETPGSSASPLP